MAISRVSSIIRLLSSHFVPLSDTLLLDAYDWLLEQDGDAKDLMQDEFGDALVAAILAK
jgi:exosome complex component RRP4